MNNRAVTIGPVFLVLSAEIAEALQTQQKDYPHLPDPTRVEADISILNDESGVPVVVAMNEQDREGPARGFTNRACCCLVLAHGATNRPYSSTHLTCPSRAFSGSGCNSNRPAR